METIVENKNNTENVENVEPVNIEPVNSSKNENER